MIFHRVLKNFGAQLLSLSVLFLDRFLVVGLLVRHWGPDRYAEWSLIYATAALLLLADLGLNLHYGNVWQAAWARDDRKRFQRMLGVSLFISLALSLLLLAIAVANSLLFAPGGAAGDTAYLILAGSMVAVVARGGISQIYRGRGDYARGTLIGMLAPLGASLGAIGVALGGGGLAALALVHLFCQVALGLGATVLDIRRRYPDLRFRPALPKRGELGAIIAQLRWLAVLVAVPVLWLQTPVLLLGAVGIAGSALVGFVLLRSLTGFIRQLATMLATATGVELSPALLGSERAATATRLALVGRFLAAMTAALCAGLYVFGEPLLAFWTGAPELFDRRVAAALLVATVLGAPALPLASAMTYAGHGRAVALALLFQLALGLPLAALLASSHGAVGVALGVAAGEIAGGALLLPLLAGRLLGFGWKRCLTTWVGIAAASATWSGAAAMALLDDTQGASIVAQITGPLIWGIVGLLPPAWLALPAPLRARLLVVSRLRAAT